MYLFLILIQTMYGSILYLLKQVRVKNIIIGKQFETCDNYEEFKKIVKEKSLKVTVIEEGKRINIEKNLYFDILWPSSKQIIRQNNINNNSLVCKLIYKDVSILFTGDIEEIAEKGILEKYKNTKNLKSTILKVAHHGSKSSSTQEFLDAVAPKIALIGVGSNNKFGHPNDEVLERLIKLNCRIYRTDECGEISILINSKGRISNIKKCIEN